MRNAGIPVSDLLQATATAVCWTLDSATPRECSRSRSTIGMPRSSGSTGHIAYRSSKG